MAVAGALLVLLVAVAALLPVPYVELSPGPTADTLGRADGKPLIVISGRQTYPTGGHLDLTTVGVTGANTKLGLLEALRGWLDDKVAVVPRETVYPEDQSPGEIEQQNVEQMELSQEHATAAALLELGVKPTKRTVLVAEVAADSPAEGKIHAGDQITAVDGVSVTSPQQVRAEIRKHTPGDQVTLTVLRSGQSEDVTVGTRAADDNPEAAQVGIAPDVGYTWPFQVDIQLDNVGGPSAGLMFALGIYDKLTPGALTGGTFVAGTGTIDDAGHVGTIGGIQMKIIGARRAGATVFLAPKGNCGEAQHNPPKGIRIVPVSTLDDALNVLSMVRSGDTDSLPTCPR
jgi:PDZ domain-containing protein